ncbi:MAG: SDR family oxidoreductase [Planctomycetota bacterium]
MFSVDEKPRIIAGVGYLGQVVARRWLKAGHQVIGTTRSTDRIRELEAMGVTPLVWDVTNPGPNRLPDAEVLLYCIGFDRSAGKPIREIYVDGLRNTLERVTGLERLIYISSTGVYGDAGGAWIDENWPPAPIDDSGQACLEAESVALAWSAQRGIPCIILRLAGIYGPGRLIGAASLRAGTPIEGDPDQCLNLIHVEDAARVVDAACVRGKGGEIYLVSDGHPIARREFYGYLCQWLGAPGPTFSGVAGRRARGSRKVSNAKMLSELVPGIHFENFRLGLDDSFPEHGR